MYFQVLHREYLQSLVHGFAGEVVIAIGVEAEVDEELNEGVGVSVSAHAVLHATREVLVVDHQTCRGDVTTMSSHTHTHTHTHTPMPRGLELIRYTILGAWSVPS